MIDWPDLEEQLLKTKSLLSTQVLAARTHLYIASRHHHYAALQHHILLLHEFRHQIHSRGHSGVEWIPDFV